MNVDLISSKFENINREITNLDTKKITNALSKEQLNAVHDSLTQLKRGNDYVSKEIIAQKKSINPSLQDPENLRKIAKLNELQIKVNQSSDKINSLIEICKKCLKFDSIKEPNIPIPDPIPPPPLISVNEKSRGLYFAFSENPPSLNSAEEGEGEIVLHQRSNVDPTKAFLALRVFKYQPTANDHTLNAISKIFRDINPLRPDQSFDDTNFGHITLGVIPAPVSPEGLAYPPLAHITSYKFRFTMERNKEGTLISKIQSIAGKILENPIIIPSQSVLYYENEEKNQLYQRNLAFFPINASIDSNREAITEPLKTLSQQFPEEFPLSNLERMNQQPLHISLFTPENMKALTPPTPLAKASAEIQYEFKQYMNLLNLYLYDCNLMHLPHPQSFREETARHYGIDAFRPLSYETVMKCKAQYLNKTDESVFIQEKEKEEISKLKRILNTNRSEQERGKIALEKARKELKAAKEAKMEDSSSITPETMERLQKAFNEAEEVFISISKRSAEFLKKMNILKSKVRKNT